MAKIDKMQGREVTVIDMVEEKRRLENIIFQLRKTLSYYADDDTYEYKAYGYQMIAAIEFDKGKKAKKALKKYTKECTLKS